MLFKVIEDICIIQHLHLHLNLHLHTTTEHSGLYYSLPRLKALIYFIIVTTSPMPAIHTCTEAALPLITPSIRTPILKVPHVFEANVTFCLWRDWIQDRSDGELSHSTICKVYVTVFFICNLVISWDRVLGQRVYIYKLHYLFSYLFNYLLT
jgi:hypothetical protein